jgi:ABC-type xylose transport system permease subunit
VIGIRNGLNLSALDSNYLSIVVGAVLVLAVGLDTGRASVESAVRRRRARRAEGIES